MSDGKIILPDSDEAATFRTNVEGWVSSNGLFFGKDERAARYNGSTHRVCEDCSKTIEKVGYTVCSDCRAKRDAERFAKLEVKPWDGSTPVFEHGSDQFYTCLEEFLDLHECAGIDPSTAMLVHAVPMKLPTIDEDFFCDVLCEDQDLPEDLCDAIDEFNKVVEVHPHFSYTASQIAVPKYVEDQDPPDGDYPNGQSI